MRTNKELFKTFINKEITSEELKDFALYVTDKIPEYFWTIPASSSRKYHSATDLGEGGLVRHSLMTARVAIDLLNTIRDETFITNKNEIILACLFHDCCKNGIENSGHTKHTHPLVAANFINQMGIEYKRNFYTGFDLIKINVIAEMISTHMGKWTTSKYSKEELPAPFYAEEIFVHQCDYIASRKYCLFDEEFFKKY